MSLFSPVTAMLGGSALDYLGQVQTNESNVQLATDQMAWQERMSNTAHQREIQDLAKAGLNPMLSVMKGGGGASTPSGSLARVENPARGLGTTAAEIAKLIPNINLTIAQTDATSAQAEKSKQEKINLEADKLILDAEKVIREAKGDVWENTATIARSISGVIKGFESFMKDSPWGSKESAKGMFSTMGDIITDPRKLADFAVFLVKETGMSAVEIVDEVGKQTAQGIEGGISKAFKYFKEQVDKALGNMPKDQKDYDLKWQEDLKHYKQKRGK